MVASHIFYITMFWEFFEGGQGWGLRRLNTYGFDALMILLLQLWVGTTLTSQEYQNLFHTDRYSFLTTWPSISKYKMAQWNNVASVSWQNEDISRKALTRHSPYATLLRLNGEKTHLIKLSERLIGVIGSPWSRGGNLSLILSLLRVTRENCILTVTARNWI